MRSILTLAGPLVLVIALASRAQADMIFTGVQQINLSGQNLIVNTVAPALWTGGTGTLSFTGVGDFDDGPGESADLYLDNIFIGTAARGLAGTVYTPGAAPGATGLHRIDATFNVSAAIMQTILGADTNLAFRIQLSPNVGSPAGFNADFVRATLAYNLSAVPEPGSMALVAMTSVLGLARRRRKSGQ